MSDRLPPELEFADDSAGDADKRDKALARTRVVAWVVIGALVIAGGGATVLSLLFG